LRFFRGRLANDPCAAIELRGRRSGTSRSLEPSKTAPPVTRFCSGPHQQKHSDSLQRFCERSVALLPFRLASEGECNGPVRIPIGSIEDVLGARNEHLPKCRNL